MAALRGSSLFPVPFEALYAEARSEEVRAYAAAATQLTREIFALAAACDAAAPPGSGAAGGARPLVFRLTHPAAVYAAKFAKKGLIHPDIQPPDASLTRIFDLCELPEGESVAASTAYPSWSAAAAFRAVVQRHVDARLDALPHPCTTRITEATLGWPLLMGIEHERLSLEAALADVRSLPLHVAAALRPPSMPPLAPSRAARPGDAPPNRLVPVPGTIVPGLGLPCGPVGVSNPAQAGDADLLERLHCRLDAVRAVGQRGMRADAVPPAAMAALLVSNAQFLPFVQAGGYAQRGWWDAQGAAWLDATGAARPPFWVVGAPSPGDDDGGAASGGAAAAPNPAPPAAVYALRTVFAEVPMPWDWPVEVTLHEARAFLRWLSESSPPPLPHGGGGGFRLPTEAEHCALLGAGPAGVAGGNRNTEWSAALPVGGCNLELRWGSPGPVDGDGAGDGGGALSGVHGLRGNVWQFVIDPASDDRGAPLPAPVDSAALPASYAGVDHALIGGCWANTGDPATSVRYHLNTRRAPASATGGFRYVVAAPPPRPADASAQTPPQRG